MPALASWGLGRFMGLVVDFRGILHVLPVSTFSFAYVSHTTTQTCMHACIGQPNIVRKSQQIQQTSNGWCAMKVLTTARHYFNLKVFLIFHRKKDFFMLPVRLGSMLILVLKRATRNRPSSVRWHRHQDAPYEKNEKSEASSERAESRKPLRMYGTAYAATFA